MITSIVTILILWTFVGGYFMLYRNFKVYNFRISTLKLCSLHAKNASAASDPKYLWAYDEFFDKGPSYDRMIWSFKPLKLENWYKKEDIEKLLTT